MMRNAINGIAVLCAAVSISAAASGQIPSPCQDSVYLSNRAKPFNALSREEVAALQKVDSICLTDFREATPMPAPAPTTAEPKTDAFDLRRAPLPPVLPHKASNQDFPWDSRPKPSATTRSPSNRVPLLVLSTAFGIATVILLSHGTSEVTKTRQVDPLPCLIIWGDCSSDPQPTTVTYTETRINEAPIIGGVLTAGLSVGFLVGGLTSHASVDGRTGFNPGDKGRSDATTSIAYTWSLD